MDSITTVQNGASPKRSCHRQATHRQKTLRIENKLFCIVSLCFLLFACGSGDTTNAATQLTPQITMPTTTVTTPVAELADTVILNGKIYTGNADAPWATHMAIKNGEIIYIGNAVPDDLMDQQTNQIDAQQRMVMAGIHDVHTHPLESASEATHFSLDEEVMRAENYADEVARAANDFPGVEWLIGYGHSIELLLDTLRSPKVILDEVVPDRPVIIMEQTSHSMWLNSIALEMAGLGPNSDDPVGGVIGRDADGELNGILYDNAGDIVMEQAMIATNSSNSDYAGLVNYAMPELNRHGITSISDARVYWQRGHLETWQRASQQNRLTLRVNLGLWAYPQANDNEQIATLLSLYNQQTNSLLQVNQVKFYMDGILSNTTAALHEPYHLALLPLPENKGLNYFTQERLEQYLAALEPVGFSFNIHAIGDRGITEALNAIENASSGNGRHRLTHLEIVHQDDLPRFAELNVIADAQVAGDFANPNHWPENIPLVGEARSDDIIPIKSLLENNATLTLSSDWNVSTLNPFVGIAHAISRAPQAISLEQAIAAYTINAAYAMKQEQRVGTLEVGKRADLIIIDRDLFASSVAQIKQTKVDITMLDGDVVYQR